MGQPSKRLAWIQTYTGKKVYPWAMDPWSSAYDILDIAHALSMTVRFGGHINKFYSVAEHSVRVSRRVDDLGSGLHGRMLGLLHDAAEAYIGDCVTPVKQQLPAFAEAEDNIMEHILSKFGVVPSEREAALVHMADQELCWIEGKTLLPHPEVMNDWGFKAPSSLAVNATMTDYGWEPERAKTAFLEKFNGLRTGMATLKRSF